MVSPAHETPRAQTPLATDAPVLERLVPYEPGFPVNPIRPRFAEDTTIIPVLVFTAAMPTNALFTTFTQQGIDSVRDSPERTEHAKELAESLGRT